MKPELNLIFWTQVNVIVAISPVASAKNIIYSDFPDS